jgi:hypothetical protein
MTAARWRDRAAATMERAYYTVRRPYYWRQAVIIAWKRRACVEVGRLRHEAVIAGELGTQQMDLILVALDTCRVDQECRHEPTPEVRERPAVRGVRRQRVGAGARSHRHEAFIRQRSQRTENHPLVHREFHCECA